MYYSLFSFFRCQRWKYLISFLYLPWLMSNDWLNWVIVVNLKPSEFYNLCQIPQFLISWFGPDFTIPTNKHDFDQSLQIELNFIIWKKCRSFQQISELWLIVTILTKVKNRPNFTIGKTEQNIQTMQAAGDTDNLKNTEIVHNWDHQGSFVFWPDRV